MLVHTTLYLPRAAQGTTHPACQLPFETSHFPIWMNGHTSLFFPARASFHDVSRSTSLDQLGGLEGHGLPPNASLSSSDTPLHHSLQLHQSLSTDSFDQDDALENINLRSNLSIDQDLAVEQSGIEEEEGSLLYTNGVTLEDSSEQPANCNRVSRMLDHVWETINKLDSDLSNKAEELDTITMGTEHSVMILEERMDDIRHSNALHKAECEVKRLELELNRMSKELDVKDRFMTVASSQMRHAEIKLTEAEILVSTVKKLKEELDFKQSEQPLPEGKFSLLGQHVLEQHSSTNKALDVAEDKILSVQELITQLYDEFNYDIRMLDILQKEANLFSQALLSANQVLSQAEDQISSLKHTSERHEKALVEERQAVASLESVVARQENDLKMENEKTQSLVAEITSLKALLDNKDSLVESMREESQQNKALLACAAKNTEALNQAHKKIEQLTAQVKAMEEQLKSRDLLLEEVRDETFKSTEALKLATRIKQDLNISRQKETELKQELESQRAFVKELQQELAENIRAVQAEQALRQMEKGYKELTVEVDILQKGTQERDAAIRIMKDEIDKNILILSNAAKSRETMRKMQLYINELEAELKNAKFSKFERHKAVPESKMEQSAISSLTSVSKMFSQLSKVSDSEGNTLQQRHSHFT